jgi:hypothetical protein
METISGAKLFNHSRTGSVLFPRVNLLDIYSRREFVSYAASSFPNQTY